MDGIIADCFAGGGGASEGMEDGLDGETVSIAINHDEEALAMHAANHPGTKHFKTNIWRVDPVEACGGKPVKLAWFSPDCTHHSKAKGGKPLKKNIRDLAWVVVMWAQRVRPTVIMVENVEEFFDWGPLGEDDLPIKARKGETFKRWVRELRRLGYSVQWKVLKACDFGAPTIRKRLFVVARCDKKPIVWPTPTHGDKPGLLPYRTAADIIDWSLPCPSIFLNKRQGRKIGVNRPLAPATMARIAKGIERYVLGAADPFIVNLTHGGRLEGLDEPLKTVTGAFRGEKAIVTPYIAGLAHGEHKERPGARSHTPNEPVRTIHAGGGNHAVVAPYLVPRYGERKGQEPRTYPADLPAPTIVPTANGGSLVQAFLAQHNTGMVGHDTRKPLSTIVGKGCTQAVVAAHIAQHNGQKGGAKAGRKASEPLSTIVHRGTQQTLVTSHIVNMKGSDQRSASIEAPLPTQTAGGNHIAEVRAFLKKHGINGAPVIRIGGEDYEIVDIGMRMLTPRELFRAQGFSDDYIIAPEMNGKPLTKTSQIRMCGNSVCPQVAAALVRANLGREAKQRKAA